MCHGRRGNTSEPQAGQGRAPERVRTHSEGHIGRFGNIEPPWARDSQAKGPAAPSRRIGEDRHIRPGHQSSGLKESNREPRRLVELQERIEPRDQADWVGVDLRPHHVAHLDGAPEFGRHDGEAGGVRWHQRRQRASQLAVDGLPLFGRQEHANQPFDAATLQAGVASEPPRLSPRYRKTARQGSGRLWPSCCFHVRRSCRSRTAVLPGCVREGPW